MIIRGRNKVTYTFVVFEKEEPRPGKYIDPRGNKWRIINIRPECCVLREPSDPVWYIDAEPEHPAYKIDTDEELKQVFDNSEIAIRRGTLTENLKNITGFEYVGVSNDGMKLIANFSCNVNEIPEKWCGMPVVLNIKL